MTKIGILSDTHLTSVSNEFLQQVENAFSDCSVIIHAGDLTEISILSVFKGKEIHAVAGNMCNYSSRMALPEAKTFVIDGYLFALCHGANGPRHNIEERMFDTFPEADCIIYGHTHVPICKQIGTTLYLNPGSFQATGRYGATGTYGIITTTAGGLQGEIKELERT